jgi:excisionase family DNA binding protein
MMSNDKMTWLTIEDAAIYLRIGKTVIYTMAREGRIPANKVGKKWMFEREQLDAWARGNQPVAGFFKSLDFKIEDNPLLRAPQREAYLRTSDFFSAGKNGAIIQIPVGCGKSGLAAILPLGQAEGRLLVIAPNLTIKNGLYEAMDITNRQKCFWRKAGVLSDKAMLSGPLACTLDSGNVSVAEKCHVVITNIQQLATNVEKWLTQFPDDFFDMIIVDEAHHSAANSWKAVLDRFPKAKVVHLTATPFRSDRQEIDGDLVYRYSFRSAMLSGYIKRLKASYVAPSEIELAFRDDGGKVYTLDEVLKLKEEVWFSRGIALSVECNKHIVDNSLEKLEELRRTGTNHQLIAVACSINHGREIRSLYQARGYQAGLVHSGQDSVEQEGVLQNLRNGTLDCVIQVQMLGEGFDHPKLSVAAIFRPFRTLAPYIQFVGRIMRVIVQNCPGHPDNLGHIVTHLGMNLDQRLKEFKQFENDDQLFWENILGGEEPEVPQSVKDGSARLKSEGRDVVVNSEVVDSVWEEDFNNLDEALVVAEIRAKMEALGLETTYAEEMVRKARPGSMVRRKPAEPFAVQPQAEWEESKKRLYEKVKTAAKILLNNAGLEAAGPELPYHYTNLKLSGQTNFACAVIMINRELKKLLPKERSQSSTAELQFAGTKLDDILQQLVRQIKKVQNEYAKENKES